MYGPGWYGGRGRGWGATLGYCPWTGMPRGWRWNYGYYPNQYYPQYIQTGQYPGAQNIQAPLDEKTALENELKYLQERIDYIRKRLEELEK
ncbi:MAG: DUF5320 domain-containing protein [Thermoplasmata archaeon]